MTLGRRLYFPPFCLDLSSDELTSGDQPLHLRPKSFAVLEYLIRHRGRLVAKEDLLDAVWPDTVVEEGALKNCIREVRSVLEDSPRVPKFIQTDHRKGYRFIAAVREEQNTLPQPTAAMVGRDLELARMEACLLDALNGQRQLIFVSGESGIGKTTLVENFVAQIMETGEIRIGCGQCIAHYGEGEAYSPILEALGQLCRGSDGKRISALLRQYAPTWCSQIPALMTTAERKQLLSRGQTEPRDRMLREMAEALELIANEFPLLLYLEDLHWSDASTIDLLALLARRKGAAKLMVVGTLRPADTVQLNAPLTALKSELNSHHKCVEIELDSLTRAHVCQYLAERFRVRHSEEAGLEQIARSMHSRTDGNPLFLVNVTSQLVEQGGIIDQNGGWVLGAESEQILTAIPENLQQLICQQLEQLDVREQRALEVASLLGKEFSAATVAAGLSDEVTSTEELLSGLERRNQFITQAPTAKWPDGTVAAGYDFLHGFYQELLAERIPAARRAQLHLKIGTRIEQGYGNRTGEVAVPLAVHFEQGNDPVNAIRYLLIASEGAIHLGAYEEAAIHLTKGLELVAASSNPGQLLEQELALRSSLAIVLVATRGWAAPETERALSRAETLCLKLGDETHRSPVMLALCLYSILRAQHQTARDLGERLVKKAQTGEARSPLLEAHLGLGVSQAWLGEFGAAERNLAQAIDLYDPERHRSHSYVYGQDPRVVGSSVDAVALWLLGHSREAWTMSRRSIKWARKLDHPYSFVMASVFAAMLHQLCNQSGKVRQHTRAAIEVAQEYGFSLYLAMANVLDGWAVARDGLIEDGIRQIDNGIKAFHETGAEWGHSYFPAILASACNAAGNHEQSVALLEEALIAADKTSEGFYKAELYRLEGDILWGLSAGRHQQLKEPEQEKIETLFRKAISVASDQSARLFELRARTCLGRLWHCQTKDEDAADLLTGAIEWFDPGVRDHDVVEARDLLRELA